jgi:hypothetical protein
MRYFLILLGIAALIGMGCPGCGREAASETVETVPAIHSLTNAPELGRYAVEFARDDAKPVEKQALLIPIGRNLIAGSIISVDHNTNCSLWLILSHSGSNYFDGQKLYLYSDKISQLNELTVYKDLRVLNSFVLSDNRGEQPFILASVWPTNSDWWVGELRTNNLRMGSALRMATGRWCKVAPDHSMAAFWRDDSAGFHSLHLWDVNTGGIQNVISMWESDPGSGTSWDWDWSADSRALNIRGTCGGFYRHRWRENKQFNLLYMVKDRQMFSIDR